MFSLILEAGIDTSSCIAVDAFLMRDSMSEIGSVIVIVSSPPPLPARFRDARDLAVVCHLAEAQPAEPETLEDGPRSPAPHAARVLANLVLRLRLRLIDQCFLSHLPSLLRPVALLLEGETQRRKERAPLLVVLRCRND